MLSCKKKEEEEEERDFAILSISDEDPCLYIHIICMHCCGWMGNACSDAMPVTSSFPYDHLTNKRRRMPNVARNFPGFLGRRPYVLHYYSTFEYNLKRIFPNIFSFKFF